MKQKSKYNTIWGLLLGIVLYMVPLFNFPLHLPRSLPPSLPPSFPPSLPCNPICALLTIYNRSLLLSHSPSLSRVPPLSSHLRTIAVIESIGGNQNPHIPFFWPESNNTLYVAN